MNYLTCEMEKMISVRDPSLTLYTYYMFLAHLMIVKIFITDVILQHA